MADSIPLNYDWHYSFHTRPTFNFDGVNTQMDVVQCIHMTRGRQCRRVSAFTIPVCWQHLKSDYHLVVGQTTLTDANGVRLPGRGVFACDPEDEGGLVFHVDDDIVPYIGENLTTAQLNALYPGTVVAPFAVPIEDGWIDPALMRGVGALINDCRIQNRNRNDCEGNNVVIAEGGAGNYPKVVATKAIFDGEELFFDYGEAYWSGNLRPMRTGGRYNQLRYKCGQRRH